MDHRASPPGPARRAPTTLLVALAILGVGITVFALRGPMAASAPSSLSATTGRPTTGTSARGDAGGAIPAGTTISVFDDDVPAVGNLGADLRAALRRAARDAEADGVELRVTGGWRSPQHQAQLWRDAVVQYGSPAEAARWVAIPETSAHVAGEAVDVGGSDAVTWLAEHGSRYGLCQIYGNEPWHYELRPAALDDGCPPPYPDPTDDPRMHR
jgi:hypothetical protein